MTKEESQQNRYIVMRVSLIDTIRNIPEGITVIFNCSKVGPMTSAKCCVSRLNKASGYEAYKISSDDNGITFSITHIKDLKNIDNGKN